MGLLDKIKGKLNDKKSSKLSCHISYGEDEEAIIKAGMVEIRRVLMGYDHDKKINLLLALDRFLDPYFEEDYSGIYEELMELLQFVVISSNDVDVSVDALQLLCDYGWSPFQILENNLEQIPQQLKPYVQYAIHMNQEH